ncbi:MAG: hypothetical protein WCW13_06115 [archaeon]
MTNRLLASKRWAKTIPGGIANLAKRGINDTNCRGTEMENRLD